MSTTILHQYAGVGAQRGVGIDHGIGQAPVELRIGLAGINLAQHHLGVRPREFKHAIREPFVLIFFDQPQHRFAAFSHADHHIDGDRLLRIERDGIADRDNRIQHRALTAGERSCG